MKYEQTNSFFSDFKKLKAEHRKAFLATVREDFIPACESFSVDPTFRWPKSLRVKAIQGAPGVWEMTWSFSGPDGRATFEFIEIDGEMAIRWRRVGSHSVFKSP